MEFSERRIATAAKTGLPSEAQVAGRLLENLPLYRNWEQSHARSMQSIIAARQPRGRITELRRVAFQAIHRKAPFEYLRDRHVTGSDRRQLVRSLFATNAYASCVVREHAAFLCASCSLLCTNSICAQWLHDTGYCDLLAEYEEAYADYYRIYCDAQIASRDGADNPDERAEGMRSLLPYLSYQLRLIRGHMLNDSADSSDFKYLQSLYAPTGDTQKLPALRIAADTATDATA